MKSKNYIWEKSYDIYHSEIGLFHLIWLSSVVSFSYKLQSFIFYGWTIIHWVYKEVSQRKIDLQYNSTKSFMELWTVGHFYISIFNPNINNYKVNYEYTEKIIFSIKITFFIFELIFKYFIVIHTMLILVFI